MDKRNDRSELDPWDRHSYGTGSTKPPKNYGGLIALMLILAIFLCGLISALHLLPESGQQSPPDTSGSFIFSNTENTGATTATDVFTQPTQSKVPRSDTEVQLNGLPEELQSLTLQQIYKKNIASVASILCQLENSSASGTGVVLSEDGYIITNAHVIEGATAIQALLTDGRTLEACVVGSDAFLDLAVLYVQADDLTPAEFGDSELLEVGELAVAIGDPLGVELRGTMTDGIISAINRDLQTNGRTMTLIQTNAALNPGNSGGPLINCYGQVIGINTMKIGVFADSSGVEGLGFAIPSATVKQIVDQLLTQGYVSGRPTLGLEGQWISQFQQQFRRLPAGLYITAVPEGAGIQTRDILLSIDGIRITDEEEMNNVLYAHQVGDEVELTLYRSGKEVKVKLALTEARE